MNEYIKKLEDTNKALEEENMKLERSIHAYKALRNHLVIALATCRGFQYEYEFKNSPKRNEKTDKAFEGLLKDIKGQAGKTDLDPFTINSYEKIVQFIEEIEKTPLDK